MPKHKCLTPGCRHKAAARGLCKTCYSAVTRMIARREVTEAQAIKRKLLLPSKKRSKVRDALQRSLVRLSEGK